jgi:hypothetical protein
MQLRPERRPQHAGTTADRPRDSLAQAYITVGTRTIYAGASSIWRWEDEPGAWRDETGKILDDKRVRHLVPELAAELEARATIDDKLKVTSEVERLLSGGVSEVIEERGPYTLVNRKGGGLIDIMKHGRPIHLAPLPEPMARAILDSLCPVEVSLTPSETPLDEELRAGAAA